MVVAQTFFGKARNIGPLSMEELFLMFIIFQSIPINYVSFLLAGLDKVANQEIENIYVGGIITHIDIALGLRN